MSFNDCKISESQIQTTSVQSQPDTLTGSAADNKMVFDALPTLAIQKLNSLIDQMQQQAAAGQIGVTPFDGMTAQTLQEALEQIQADIGGNYGGEDGAGKVGYTPSEGVEEDTVQAAIEAVQANLTAYIAKIKAATGAAEVGNAPIAGMTATNVQHALEELRKNIDNIVSGIIPGGSITSEMIQDGAVTADKLGSDVTGDTIPTSASDPTTISSQLSNTALSSHGILQDVNILDWAVTRKRSGAFTSQPGCTGVPNSSLWYAGNLFVNIAESAWSIILIEASSMVAWYNATESGVWKGWKPIATATPPQEFDLPLAEGLQPVPAYGSNKYRKNQFNEVGITISVTKTDIATNDIENTSLLATLPAGFRPATLVSGAAFVDRGEESVVYPAFIAIHPDGSVRINQSNAVSCSMVVASISFVAAT